METKYLFVINSFLAGGAERSLLEFLPYLAERGIIPIVACLHHRAVGFEEEARSSGFDVRLLKGQSRLSKIRHLRRLIEEEQPSLVYSSLFDADVAARLACIGRDVPVISNLANTTYDPARLGDPNVNPLRLRMVRWIDGVTARHLTDHFHAISHAVKDSAVRWLRVPPGRVTVVKRGRDRGRLGERSESRRITVRDQLGIAGHEEVVVAVGRQEYQKGHRFLIEAFEAVVADRSDARLLIAGREGRATSQLQSLVSDRKLGRRVRLLGHRHDVADIMACADLFVFPSLYEGLGGALIEAVALSLPIVASDLPAVREVVEAGENADLVPPANVGSLHQAIVSLLGDPARLVRYGARSRQIFETNFRSEVANERMFKLLTNVSSRAGPYV